MNSLVLEIDAILPQTQCTKCGYEGCLPYAEAIAQGEAINRCPPGGQEGIDQLAELLNKDSLELNIDCGVHQPLQVAKINEDHCIGCTLCIKACPVDAIIGANKFMHTVDPELCTGCDLCVPPCPVDCIDMLDANRTWTEEDAKQARQNFHNHQQRLNQLEQQESERLKKASLAKAQNDSQASHTSSPDNNKKDAIAAALARARARRQDKN